MNKTIIRWALLALVAGFLVFVSLVFPPSAGSWWSRTFPLVHTLTPEEAEQIEYGRCYRDLWGKMTFTPGNTTPEVLRETQRTVENFCKGKVDK